MSKLELYMRPLAIFDANNKKHRQYYFNFVKNGSWSGCPYRWAVEEDYGHLVGHMEKQILAYYMGREFKKVEPVQDLVRQKRKKTVDKQPKK